jgi:uncharacterized membrane protein YhdT
MFYLYKDYRGKAIPTNPYNQWFDLNCIFNQLHFIKRGEAFIIQKLLEQKKLMGFPLSIPLFFSGACSGLVG